MRKLVILAIAFAMFASAEQSARADVGIGAFIGRPTGLDVKLGLARRSSLDLLIGWYSGEPLHCVDCGAYGHVTYLLTPLIGQGESVNVPVRIGIGGAIYDRGDYFRDNLHLAARFPLEIALAFRRTPLEIYLELALKVTVLQDRPHDNDTVDIDGGLGIRFYF